MKIVLTPQAVTDIEKAVDYYRDIDHELSARFLDDIGATIARIMAFPQGVHRRSKGSKISGDHGCDNFPPNSFTSRPK